MTLNNGDENISIAAINVHGLESKLIADDLENLMYNYPFICLTETFIISTQIEDYLNDENTIPGYKLIHKPRSHFKRPSGGIALAVKQKFSKYVKYLENESEHILWCRIDKSITSTNEDILLGCIYIPPENSQYVTSSCFDEIENEIISFSNLSDNVILTGDFNAHTSNQIDILIDDQCDFINDNILSEDTAENSILNLGLPLYRMTDDQHKINKWGSLLLEFCKTTGMCIVNGRFGPPSSKCTTINDTVIDYFICTPTMLSFISNMNVHTFNPCLSDVHTVIDICLKNNSHSSNQPENDTQTTSVGSEQVTTDQVKVGAWDNSKCQEYIENLNTKLLHEINDHLEIFDNTENKQDQIDTILDQVGQLLVKAAKDTFGQREINSTINKKKKEVKTQSKPWYTKYCRNKKVIFNRARKRFQITKANNDFQIMQREGKEYKRAIRAAYNKHRENVREEVRNLRYQNNTQKYWNYIKKQEKNYDNEEKIDFDKFVDFFRNINSAENYTAANIEKEQEGNEVNEELDKEISEREITEAVSNLKNNKAVGEDKISNEYIKASIDTLKPVYKKIFNIVYSTGIIPTNWTLGVIKPIYKNKGSKADPDNYRPITILSCMGKLFSSILNNRLSKYLKYWDAVGEEQLGFKQNYSTTDGIFVLNSLIELLKAQKKTLFCAFIDLKKCFGSIWREGLWTKLSTYGLGSKMMNILKSIYQNVKSCLKMNCRNSDGTLILNGSQYFNCSGLREGDVLSPILFSLYVNDLRSFLERDGCQGVNIPCEDEIAYYVHMLLLMYADDTVLLATSKIHLQKLLNSYSEYCQVWKLKINTDKTKIMTFGKKRNHKYILNGQAVEVVDSFKYLGVIFSRNGKFINAVKENINKARKAIHILRRNFKNNHIPIDCQIDILEKTVEPILLYGAEIWGICKTCSKLIDQFYLKTLKNLLSLRKSTPSYMVYSEIGKYPCSIAIKVRILSFTKKLLEGSGEKFSEILFGHMCKNENESYKWIKGLRDILHETGFSFLTNNLQNLPNYLPLIYQTLKDQASQSLNTDSSKCTFYRYIKNITGMEYYLTILNRKQTYALLKFRTGNHNLPIEAGRFNNTPLVDRICPFCYRLGDEYHYILECSKFENARNKYLKKHYFIRPNMFKLYNLYNSTDIAEIHNLANFVDIIIKTFKK